MLYSYKDISHTYIHATFLHTGVTLLNSDFTIVHNEVTSLQKIRDSHYICHILTYIYAVFLHRDIAFLNREMSDMTE